jgi:hypothetical protein
MREFYRIIVKFLTIGGKGRIHLGYRGDREGKRNLR